MSHDLLFSHVINEFNKLLSLFLTCFFSLLQVLLQQHFLWRTLCHQCFQICLFKVFKYHFLGKNSSKILYQTIYELHCFNYHDTLLSWYSHYVDLLSWYSLCRITFTFVVLKLVAWNGSEVGYNMLAIKMQQ